MCVWFEPPMAGELTPSGDFHPGIRRPRPEGVVGDTLLLEDLREDAVFELPLAGVPLALEDRQNGVLLGSVVLEPAPLRTPRVRVEKRLALGLDRDLDSVAHVVLFQNGYLN